MAEPIITAPAGGAKITISGGKLNVPNNPIIPFIEGDGTGPDIWAASVRVLDAAVAKAYGGEKKIHWLEVYAGEKSNNQFGTWLPESSASASASETSGSSTASPSDDSPVHSPAAIASSSQSSCAWPAGATAHASTIINAAIDLVIKVPLCRACGPSPKPRWERMGAAGFIMRQRCRGSIRVWRIMRHFVQQTRRRPDVDPATTDTRDNGHPQIRIFLQEFNTTKDTHKSEFSYKSSGAFPTDDQ